MFVAATVSVAFFLVLPRMQNLSSCLSCRCVSVHNNTFDDPYGPHRLIDSVPLTASGHPQTPFPRTVLVSHRSCSDDARADCNRNYTQRMNALKEEVRLNFSQQVHAAYLYSGLPVEIRSNPKWSSHVVPQLRGRGYWFWKPAIINMLLEKGNIRFGDYVIYMDSDLEASKVITSAIQRINASMSLNASFDIMVARMQGYCEHRWTKGDIFARFGVHWSDPHYGPTRQVQGNMFVLHITIRTRKFIQLWEDLASDFHLISDEPSVAKSMQSPYFDQNRHDQSLLSMLIKASTRQIGACSHNNRLEAYDKRLQQASAARGVQLPPPPQLFRPENEYKDWQLHNVYGVSGLRTVFW